MVIRLVDYWTILCLLMSSYVVSQCAESPVMLYTCTCYTCHLTQAEIVRIVQRRFQGRERNALRIKHQPGPAMRLYGLQARAAQVGGAAEIQCGRGSDRSRGRIGYAACINVGLLRAPLLAKGAHHGIVLQASGRRAAQDPA